MVDFKGVSYYGSHFDSHIEKDIIEIKNHGCNQIVIAASEYDLDFYFPSTKKVVDLAHKYGLRVFLDFWAHGGTFGGEAASFFLMKNPHCCQVSEFKKTIPRACFNREEFKRFMNDTVIKCCTKLNIDGIFWDEPHFHSEKNGSFHGCFCEVCRKKFHLIYGKEMSFKLDKNVIDFRNQCTFDFLSSLSKLVKSINPRLLISICSFPKERDPTSISWEDICKIKEIDIFGSDPYWINRGKPVSFVSEVTEKVVKVAKEYGKKSEIWIQLFKIPKGREEEVRQAILVAASHNPDSINSWTYRAAQNSILESGEWTKIWDILKETYDIV